MIRRAPWGVLVAAAAAALFRVPSLLSTRPLTFDDGVYGASVIAMRDGGLPFRDVFSSQGPLFLPILWLSDVIGFRDVRAFRLSMVAAGVASAVGTYLIARKFAGKGLSSVAALVVATSSSALLAAGPVQSDGIALALGTFAVWAAMKDTPRRPILVGLLIGAAAAVKSALVLPAILAAGLAVFGFRRWRGLGIAFGSAAALGLAVSIPWGLGNVWEQSIAFQLRASRNRSPLDNLDSAGTFLWNDEGPILVFIAVAILWAGGMAIRRRRAVDPPPLSAQANARLAIWIWLGSSALLLTVGVELASGFTRFLAFAVVPAVIASTMSRVPFLIALVAVGALMPRHFDENETRIWRVDLIPVHQEVVAAFDKLPAGALVVTDRPGLAWAAERPMPGGLVDVSWARIRAGDVTASVILEATRQNDVCGVLFYTGRFDSMSREIESELDGYSMSNDWGGGRRLWLAEDCRPDS